MPNMKETANHRGGRGTQRCTKMTLYLIVLVPRPRLLVPRICVPSERLVHRVRKDEYDFDGHKKHERHKNDAISSYSYLVLVFSSLESAFHRNGWSIEYEKTSTILMDTRNTKGTKMTLSHRTRTSSSSSRPSNLRSIGTAGPSSTKRRVRF